MFFSSLSIISSVILQPRTEEDKLAGRLEVKRYKQTKEKLRRRREKILQKVRLLAANKSQRRFKGSVMDLKVSLEYSMKVSIAFY